MYYEPEELEHVIAQKDALIEDYENRITELEQQLAEREGTISYLKDKLDNADDTWNKWMGACLKAEAKLTERDKLLDECARMLPWIINNYGYSSLFRKEAEDCLTKLQERKNV